MEYLKLKSIYITVGTWNTDLIDIDYNYYNF